MKQVPLTSPVIHSRRRLIVALVILVGQVGVVAAGLLHPNANANAMVAAHFESGGTDLHYSHNEADCFTCRVQHLGNAALFNDGRDAIPTPKPLSIASADIRHHASDWYAPQQSRAPPTIV